MTSASSRRYLVTGAATGIGAAVARRLLADGASVIGIGLDEDSGEAEERAARRRGQDLRFRKVDLTDGDAITACFTDLHIEERGLDGVVNCAGIYPVEQRLEDVQVADFRRVLDVNVMSVFLVCRAALPVLRHGGGGAVVNLSSVHSVAGAPGQGAYAASKAAVVALTRQIAVDYAADGIRANSIVLGSVDTRITRAAIARSGAPDALGLHSDARSLGRIADPDEVAGIVAFLLGEDSRFLTASAVLADGGLTASIL